MHRPCQLKLKTYPAAAARLIMQLIMQKPTRCPYKGHRTKGRGTPQVRFGCGVTLSIFGVCLTQCILHSRATIIAVKPRAANCPGHAKLLVGVRHDLEYGTNGTALYGKRVISADKYAQSIVIFDPPKLAALARNAAATYS